MPIQRHAPSYQVRYVHTYSTLCIVVYVHSIHSRSPKARLRLHRRSSAKSPRKKRPVATHATTQPLFRSDQHPAEGRWMTGYGQMRTLPQLRETRIRKTDYALYVPSSCSGKREKRISSDTQHGRISRANLGPGRSACWLASTLFHHQKLGRAQDTHRISRRSGRGR